MTPLDRIIADLEHLDIRAALAGINQSLPGWPSGGNGGSNPELDDNGDPYPALTKVEATAITIDKALTAHRTYPRLCIDVLRASEAVSGLRLTVEPTEPSRVVPAATTLLRAHRGVQAIDDRATNRLDTATTRLYRETHYWAAIAKPTNARPVEGAGIVTTDPKWCTSCLRLGHCEPRTKSGTLCRWCQDYNRAQGTLPPTALLAKRHRGERITTRDLERRVS